MIWLLPLLIIGTLVFLARSPLFLKHPDELSVGITLDFVVTLPLVFYLLIRKRNVSWLVVSPVATLGIILAGLVIPHGHQGFLAHIRVAAVSVMEILVTGFLVHKTLRARKTYKLQKETTFDFFTALKQTVAAVVPKGIANLLSTEIGILYYALFSWKKSEIKPNEFTCHRENGTVAVLCVIIFMVLVETVVQHILIGLFSQTAAWVITILSIYSVLALTGAARSLGRRFVEVSDENIYLRYGILAEAVIPRDIIKSIEFSKAVDENAIILSPLHKLESINVVFTLNKQCALTGFYGRTKNFSSIAFYIDDAGRFKSMLAESISG